MIVLEEITDDIKQVLKERLADYCYGSVQVGEDPDYYSYELTVTEFFRLYDTKGEKARLGLAGELVVRLLIPQGHEALESACVFLNKEEHSSKKGFDLTFRDRLDDGPWYGEVKAGLVVEGKTANAKARERIGEAERSLEEMFTTDIEKKRWDAAILDANLALQDNKAGRVKDLLRTDFKEVHRGASKKIRALQRSYPPLPAQRDPVRYDQRTRTPRDHQRNQPPAPKMPRLAHPKRSLRTRDTIKQPPRCTSKLNAGSSHAMKVLVRP